MKLFYIDSYKKKYKNNITHMLCTHIKHNTQEHCSACNYFRHKNPALTGLLTGEMLCHFCKFALNTCLSDTYAMHSWAIGMLKTTGN